ncbi:hypothetical protein DEV91_1049 [Phyllobacterium brassicacearum]|nr:hypothetical protein DEV91_1049 [Phyllobacterium brassicacearum]
MHLYYYALCLVEQRPCHTKASTHFARRVDDTAFSVTGTFVDIGFPCGIDKCCSGEVSGYIPFKCFQAGLSSESVKSSTFAWPFAQQECNCPTLRS